MTRVITLHLAGSLALLLIGAIAGSEITARPSGVDAPELQPQLSEKMPVPFINGRPVVTPDWSAVLPFGPWNGCNGPCGEKVGVIEDAPGQVPAPAAIWAAMTGIVALVAAKWGKKA